MVRFWAKGFFTSDLIPFYSFLFVETLLICFPYDNFDFNGLKDPDLRSLHLQSLVSIVYHIAAHFVLVLPLCIFASCLLMALVQEGPVPLAPDLALTSGLLLLLLTLSRPAVTSVTPLPFLPSSPWYQRRRKTVVRWWRRAVAACAAAAKFLITLADRCLTFAIYLLCLAWISDLLMLCQSMGTRRKPRPLRVNCYPKFVNVDEFCGSF